MQAQLTQRIEAENQKIEDFKLSRKWKGKLASKDVGKAETMRKDLLEMEKIGKAEIEAARQRNTGLIQQYDSENESTGYTLVFLGLFFEVIFVFAMASENRYLYKCDLEFTANDLEKKQKAQAEAEAARIKAEEEKEAKRLQEIRAHELEMERLRQNAFFKQNHQPHSPINNDGTTIVNANNDTKRPIGFYNDNRNNENDNSSTLITETPTPTTIIVEKIVEKETIVAKEGWRNCIVCGVSFPYNAKKHVHCSYKCRLAKHKLNKGEASLFDILKGEEV
jgi:predicted nucleic acid-binding Zn ribbon protein